MHTDSAEMRGNGISIRRKSSSSSSSMKCCMKSALTRIPGIVFHIAGPRGWKLKHGSPLHSSSSLLSYPPFASRRIFNFALSSSSSSRESHCTRPRREVISISSPLSLTAPSLPSISTPRSQRYITNISVIRRTKIILQSFASRDLVVAIARFSSSSLPPISPIVE